MDLLIRPYERDDAAKLFEAALESVDQIFPWLEWCHPGYSLEESKQWINRCEAMWKDQSEYNFAIADTADHLLGGCGLNQLRPEHGIANLGYWVRTSATNHGVATLAVQKLKEFAFLHTNLIRLEIVVALENGPSHRVAQKAGAIREGIVHDRLMLHGRSHDAVLYALLRSRHAGRHLETTAES